MRGRVDFWKVHAEGNSYVVVDDRESLEPLLRWVNDATSGLGGDGLLLRSYEDDVVSMRVFNADGSEAPMCGNGARCLAALEFDARAAESNAEVIVKCGDSVVVHRLESRPQMLIDAALELLEPWRLGEGPRGRGPHQLEVGAPHLVVLTDITKVVPARDGPKLERSRANGTNVMFTALAKPGELDVIPWERGVGAVAGCATGAAAAAIVATTMLPGWPRRIRVRQPGGQIEVTWKPECGKLHMHGTARIVASGRLFL